MRAGRSARAAAAWESAHVASAPTRRDASRWYAFAAAQASAASASLASAAELHRPRDALCLRPREVGRLIDERVTGRAVAVHVEAARRVRGEVEQASCGRPGLLARRVELHEEEGDAAVAVLRVGAREDDDPVGPRAEGGPHLLAAPTKWSPSRRAAVLSAARSLPAPGSLKPWHQISSPESMGWMKRRRCP